MLVDANILLYAVDERSPFHDPARTWLETALNGDQRIAMPWQSLWAFLRITTNPRALADPLSSRAAWDFVAAWLDAAPVWIPSPGNRHGEILQHLLTERDLRGNLVTDAVLVALCLEFGLSIVSADSDFARFPEIGWINPVA
jgi:uncharacterized protein